MYISITRLCVFTFCILALSKHISYAKASLSLISGSPTIVFDSPMANPSSNSILVSASGRPIRDKYMICSPSHNLYRVFHEEPHPYLYGKLLNVFS